MTAAAIFEGEVASKSTISVMTTRARFATRRYRMFGRRWRTDLARLRKSARNCVTLGARQSLSAAMLRMTERIAKGTRVGRRSRKRFLIVTNSARRDLASTLRFAARRVTAVALVVSRDSRRNTERSRTCASGMASVATTCRSRRAVHVLRMIELHVEALVELSGKTFQRRIRAVHV